MQLLAKEYEPKGVIFAFISGGENEAALMDYLKHYRSESIGLVDFDYKMQTDYHARGWPQAFIIGPDGQIKFHVPMVSRDEARARRVLDEACRRLTIARKDGVEEPHCSGGVCYVPKTHSTCPPGRRDFLPRGAVDNQNQLWVVFTSNRDRNNNIYLRCHGEMGGQRFDHAHRPELVEGKDILVTESQADDYSPDIAASGDGSLWVTWVANRLKKYDVYARRFRGGQWSATMPVTQSDDDAFHPRIASDAKGSVLVTYYKWNRAGKYSRDRDVFARIYDGRSWGEEIEVSPPEPKVEDHTDPAIAVDSQGQAWIAWSYDYHPQLFKAPEDADQPTIFAQKLASGQKAGSPLLVGTRGEGIHAIDLFPSIAVGPDDEVWCAWDATKNHGRARVILAARLQGHGSLARSAPSSTFGSEVCVSNMADLASSPSLCVDSSGTPHAVWRQYVEGHWVLVGSHGPNGRWSEPAIWEKAEGDSRAAQVLADNKGGLWLVYEQQVKKDSEVLVKKLK